MISADSMSWSYTVRRDPRCPDIGTRPAPTASNTRCYGESGYSPPCRRGNCRGVEEAPKPCMPRDLPLCNNNAVTVGCRFRHPTLTQGLAAQAVERAMSTAILSWRAAIFSASLALAFCPPSSVLSMTRSALRAWARSRMASLRP